MVLAKVEIRNRQQKQKRRSEWFGMQKSNELITDLESQLSGGSVGYIQVRLRYRHSGFPTSDTAGVGNGTTDCQTRLETTAIGVIDQHALYTPWSQSRLNLSESTL